MTQEELNRIIDSDSYFAARKDPSEAEIRLFLREVDFHCPLCGVELQSRQQKKPRHKRFEIAHIYPNRPTIEQKVLKMPCKNMQNRTIKRTFNTAFQTDSIQIP